MLETILRHIKNYFVRVTVADEFVIESGSITLPFLVNGQYFRVIGSRLNDGVYQYPASGLRDETFSGEVWVLAIPGDLLSLVSEIEAWQEKNGEAVSSPYQSESFGGYSYSKDANASGWESAFRTRLNAWRRA